ncbi:MULTISPECIES: WbqC family protein [Exiguobacterium]|uniref:WbqC family protein n=1 Tax=Exiguobacterium TaxID=33986 RepID=UPI001BED2A0C|nr:MULTISPECIES: WbqC family protein [Exiguobacterium]MCT4781665.1 WbqC family protein [Exiguobacterium himgiriensis]
MKVAIMQPYFFPYIGYYQLIHAVDTFVIYDDVHFIKKGWIHRNYILVDEHKVPLTMSVKKMSQNRLILEHERANIEDVIRHQLKHLYHGYRRTSQFERVMPVLEQAIEYEDRNVSRYLAHSIETIARYLGIRTNIICSSDLAIGKALRGQDRVLAICQALGATEYINAINGRALYDADAFDERGIRLSFIDTDIVPYDQGMETFEPYLSIIDLMMHCSKEEMQLMLDRYALISNRQVT